MHYFSYFFTYGASSNRVLDKYSTSIFPLAHLRSSHMRLLGAYFSNSFCSQNLQIEIEKTKVKYQELEKQKTEAQGKIDELDEEVREILLWDDNSFARYV